MVDPFTVELVDTFGIEYCNNHPMMGKLPFDTSQPEKLSKVQRAVVRMVGAQVWRSDRTAAQTL